LFCENYLFEDYYWKSGIRNWILALALSGRKRGDREVRITPISHYWEPYSRIEDYRLKESIRPKLIDLALLLCPFRAIC